MDACRGSRFSAHRRSFQPDFLAGIALAGIVHTVAVAAQTGLGILVEPRAVSCGYSRMLFRHAALAAQVRGAVVSGYSYAQHSGRLADLPRIPAPQNHRARPGARGASQAAAQSQADFPVIVVGGTNGKGSVCAMLESMLHAAGYRVGCYTSPHLLHYNERVRIAKQQASDAELCASFEKIEQVRGDIPLTYFEFGTLAAMQCFIEHKVDVAILEVGLGGRLDAVNVFDNDCAVIASVDIDHTDYLGDTREQIAFEKAGIMRGGGWRSARMPMCRRRYALMREIGDAELWCIGREFGFTPHQGQWDYRSKVGSRNALPYPALRGAFQLHNASAALAALDVLKDRLPVSMEAVRRGLVEVQLAGTFPVRARQAGADPGCGAQSPCGAFAGAESGRFAACARTYWAVFAMLKDKDMAGVVAALDPHIDTWLVAGIATPRGATPEQLEQVLEQGRVRGEIKICKDIPDALRYAYNAAGENDRIIAFGSFYTVAEVMAAKGLSIT